MSLEIAQNITYDLQVTIGNTDVSNFVTSFEFSEQLGRKATGKLVLVEKDADNLIVRPSKFGPDGGSLPLHPHNLTMSQVVSVNLLACGVDSVYPTFLIGDVDFGENGEVTVSLEDCHALIEQDGVSLDDILAENEDETTAHEAINSMCSDVGLLANITWADYPINELRRAQGSRKKWIDMLGKPYQAYTSFQGIALWSKSPGWTSGAEFDFTDVLNLSGWTMRETTAGHKNRFRATRLQPGASRVLGEARGTTVGRNSETQITIDPPGRSVSFYKVLAEEGDLIDLVWFDEADNVLGQGVTYTGATPAAKLEFTYIYTVGPAAFDPEFHAYVLGAIGQATDFDTSFHGVANSSNEQSFYGIREEFSQLEDPIWPTSELAQAAADNMALENAHQRYLGRGRSWLNPRVRAGTRVSITDYGTRQSGSVWVVRSVNHRYTPTDPTMSFGCSKRRDS